MTVMAHEGVVLLPWHVHLKEISQNFAEASTADTSLVFVSEDEARARQIRTSGRSPGGFLFIRLALVYILIGVVNLVTTGGVHSKVSLVQHTPTHIVSTRAWGSP